MAENFSTYTEVDTSNRITKTDSVVTFAGLTRVETGYVYFDKGANYFDGNFTHDITLNLSAHGQAEVALPWVLANNIGGYIAVRDAGNGMLVAYLVGEAGVIHIRAVEVFGVDGYSGGNITLSLSTTYYLRMYRDESVGAFGTLYLYVYSDAARTTLVGSSSVALHSLANFRYVYPFQSITYQDPSYTISGYTENLTLMGQIIPLVSTEPVTLLTGTTATGNGTIRSVGASAVTQHGHCWATTVNPTTADSKTENGAGSLGAFTSAITSLSPGTKYFVRAYATNGSGTGYGSNISFVAGSLATQLSGGNIVVKGTTLRYVGYNGIEYYIQGIVV